MQQSTVILISLIAYKLVLIGIGLWASRRVKTDADFFLGGRNLGPWVAGLSYAASTSSAWVLLGFSGFVYAFGVSALWMIPGIWGGYVAMWVWLGPRIREESKKHLWVTPTEFLSANIDQNTRRIVAIIASLMILFCFVFYIAAQFDAAAQAFVTNFGLSVTGSVILGATIILIYCLLGGFWAVSVTDTLQGIIMMLVALLIPFLALLEAGGYGTLFQNLQATASPEFSLWHGGRSGFVLFGFIFGIMAIGLGTLGQPHLIARLMAVKGDKERRQGFAVAMAWAVLVYIGMSTLALSARSLSLEPGNGEQLFYLMANQLLPPILAGIVIAAILSAVMSTVDSLLLAASAAVSHDLGLSKRIPGKELTISRMVMTAIAIFAVVLTLTLPDTIFNRVLFAWSALGAAFGPLIIARVLGREPS
ncbi:MAG: sodium/proline symporter, partial [Pseudomonadota bacterium]